MTHNTLPNPQSEEFKSALKEEIIRVLLVDVILDPTNPVADLYRIRDEAEARLLQHTLPDEGTKMTHNTLPNPQSSEELEAAFKEVVLHELCADEDWAIRRVAADPCPDDDAAARLLQYNLPDEGAPK